MSLDVDAGFRAAGGFFCTDRDAARGVEGIGHFDRRSLR